MTFISYAQNLEDVMLWRALKHVHHGFYVDVGAWSPELDSVTRAFYERGWRGINIEPNPEFHRQLQEARPRDVNLCLALSDAPGTGMLNIMSNPGLSTLDDEIAEDHIKAGYGIERKPVDLATLSQVWTKHVAGWQDVHFLKVDVEGFENRVLRGNDWARYRPWIVLVEATYPSSPQESYSAWEPYLTRHDYLLAYADGLNRFYIAREHDELMSALRYPPNYFDGFKRYALVSLEEQLARAAASAEQAESRALELLGERDKERAEKQELGKRCAALERELAEAKTRTDRLTRKKEQPVNELRDALEWRSPDMKTRASRVRRMAIFTIVSNNYLHFARTLMESARTQEPECDRYVLVLDNPVVDEAMDDAGLYTAIAPGQLSLPEPGKFLFRYNILEANTAVKPWVVEYLSGDLGYDAVIYLDPDIYVYRPLVDVKALLRKGATLVLTPHLTGPVKDDKRPNERDILKAGTYNLGFAAIGQWSSSKPLIKWWQERLERYCVVDVANGLFVDQKWMNYAPGLFQNVATLRHKGYNVAYWNLHERPIRQQDGEWLAGNVSLHFFHFSGLNVDDPSRFSKHQTRFALEDVGDAKGLVLEYCRRLKVNGADHFQHIPYGFARHAAGYTIPDTVRRLYRNNPAVEEAWGDDPFSEDLTPVLNAFDENDRRTPRMTRLMRWIWWDRPDLQAAFPNPEDDNRIEYVNWFVKNARQQFELAQCWIAPARAQLAALRSRGMKQAVPTLVDEVVGLFSLHGEAFLRKAYRLVLNRAVDPDGLRHYTGGMDRGELTRRRVMWALVFCAEARRQRRRLWEMALFCVPVPLLKPFSRRSRHQRLRQQPVPDRNVEVVTPPRRRKTFETSPGTRGSTGAGLAIRVVGYLDMTTGVGESARRCVAAAEAAGIGVEKWRVGPDQRFECQGVATDSLTNPGSEPSITLAHINADQLCAMGERLDHVDGGSSYRIGYWHWELTEFPKQYFDAFNFVDEIWVPSDHILFTLMPISPLPVVKIPHSIELQLQSRPSRSSFGIPKEAFAFLCMYDLCSYQERKNPMAAVQAYLRAFPRASDQHCLVIKVTNPEFDAQSFSTLLQEVRDREDILLLSRTMDREEVYRLESVIDCFVSLHRAEGFGLGAAECMYLGKPVVATGWSGNMEFMSEENSYLVDYQITEIAETVGPYEAGQAWAEPDVAHAASLMQEVFNNEPGRRKKSELAMRTIKENFSARAVGAKYKNRIGSIIRLAHSRPGQVVG